MKNSYLFFSMTYEFLRVFLPKEIGRSPHTIEAYADALTLFRKYINEVMKLSISAFEFKNCNRECIFGFMDYLKERGNLPSTRNYRLAALKSYLTFASDKDVSLLSIALEVKRVPQCKVHKIIKPVLTVEGFKEILKQPKNNKKGFRNLVFLVLMYDSAARLDELLSLTVDKLFLDKEYPYIIVLGKGNQERTIYLNNLTKKYLEEYLSVYHDEDSPETNLLFYTEIKGTVGKIAESTVERFLKLYAISASDKCKDIPYNTHPHQIRACRATEDYQQGIPLDVISRKLGHAQLETSRIYAKPSDAMMRATVNSINPPKGTSKIKLWKNKEDLLAEKCGLH